MSKSQSIEQLRQFLRYKLNECLRRCEFDLDVEHFARRVIQHINSQQPQYLEIQAAIQKSFNETVSILVAFLFLRNGLNPALQTEFEHSLDLGEDKASNGILCLLQSMTGTLNLAYQNAKMHETLLQDPDLYTEFETACDSLSSVISTKSNDLLFSDLCEAASDQVKIVRGFATGFSKAPCAEIGVDRLPDDVVCIYAVECPFTKNDFDLLLVVFEKKACRLIYDPGRNASWQVFRRFYKTYSGTHPANEIGDCSSPASKSVLRFFCEDQPKTVSIVNLSNANLPFHVLEDSCAEARFVHYAPSSRKHQPNTEQKITFWSPFAAAVNNSIQVDSNNRRIVIDGTEIRYPYAESVQGIPSHNNHRLLVNSEMEKWKLLNLAQSTIETFEGNEATRERFLRYRFDKTDIVHIASHARAIDENPMLNHIVFFDECIHFADVQSLKLSNTSLVFLNCCSSDWGSSSHSNEKLSLAWAFKAAGAQSVVGTLWPIDDSASFLFMSSFYEYLLHEKTSVTEAFFQAKRSLYESSRYSHPFFWGAYVLIHG